MTDRSRLWAFVMVLGGLLLLGLGSGCSESSLTDEPTEPAQMIHSGSWYSRQQWPHDGNPYESPNLVIYSDAASLEARQAVAEVGEEVLAETTAEFGIDPDRMFRFPSGQDKIHIYAYHDYYPQTWGMRAYYGGLIAWSLDHQQRSTELENYRLVVKHEMVHVVESLLKGRDATEGSPVDLWFSEGLAEALTGGVSGGAIRDLERLNDLTAEYGQLNPIAYRFDSQVTGGVEAYWYYHYPIYQLAVEYLMDADGLGKSPRDVANIFLGMGEGTNFPTAFENHMGISLSDYEEQFFGLMGEYLPASGRSTVIPLGSTPSNTDAPVVPISLALLLVAAAGLVTWRIRSRRRSKQAA